MRIDIWHLPSYEARDKYAVVVLGLSRLTIVHPHVTKIFAAEIHHILRDLAYFRLELVVHDEDCKFGRRQL